MSKQFATYILTNPLHTVIYTGVTNDLVRRIYEHKSKKIAGFTQKYNVTELVYYELFNDAENVIAREKQIKNLVRRKKIALVNEFNPTWKDLYKEIL